ncbi:DUF551 domain-containing protein [Salmonella enterica]|uniref:DUF551 domain-containing protein n=1 Tax=Salmonella enterica subsp. enterica serovar Agona TaxID=58095 RepID=A0A5Y0F6F8_SALET|nr:DUF551 domain-containing protein [Salmonella enterica subsp. enterica serovar Agona]EAR5163071.1 DUF551 domain-containing protein [Salmonella enterica]EBH8260487.1 DUF551 domain-containing protein [Salmonella enterica subsp. enterica serovar Agona str. SL483]HBM1703501.1 DUF551 domain-containing protein [Salmonella enterica subsp. enterica]EAY2119573.1 DUF551 domain-containing protein [Salmonella enterica]
MKENQIRELVNELRDIAIEYHGTQQLRERIARTVRAAIIQAGNSPVTQDGWISCSERMPEDGQHVIILCDGAFVLHAQYRDGEFFDIVRNGDEFFETQSRNVTDWMPLPEPPQEVK